MLLAWLLEWQSPRSLVLAHKMRAKRRKATDELGCWCSAHLSAAAAAAQLTLLAGNVEARKLVSCKWDLGPA